MSLRRGMALALGSSYLWRLPTLYGTPDVWIDASDKESLIVEAGDKVSTIINKGAGGTGKNFIQASTSNQGILIQNAINGKASINGFITYSSGTVSDYKYMHDRSTAYAVFDVFAYNVTPGGSPIINSTTNGGNTNGVLLFPFGTNGLRKVIRQADAGGTTSTDIIVAVTGNSIWSTGVPFLISDVFYGYQVAGDDYTLSINGNSAAATVATATTSSFASLDPKYAYTVGQAGSLHNLAEKIIIKWSGHTRAEMDADIAAIKLYINTKYALW